MLGSWHFHKAGVGLMANCAPDSETAEDPKERFGGCSISFLAPPPPGVLTTRKQKISLQFCPLGFFHTLLRKWWLCSLSLSSANTQPGGSTTAPEMCWESNSPSAPFLSLCLSPLLTALLLCRLSHATISVTDVWLYFNFPLNPQNGRSGASWKPNSNNTVHAPGVMRSTLHFPAFLVLILDSKVPILELKMWLLTRLSTVAVPSLGRRQQHPWVFYCCTARLVSQLLPKL